MAEIENSDWITIFNGTDPLESGIILGVLHDHGIEAVSMNKQDSAYVSIGEIEILVHPDKVDEARKLIHELRDLEEE